MTTTHGCFGQADGPAGRSCNRLGDSYTGRGSDVPRSIRRRYRQITFPLPTESQACATWGKVTRPLAWLRGLPEQRTGWGELAGCASRQAMPCHAMHASQSVCLSYPSVPARTPYSVAAIERNVRCAQGARARARLRRRLRLPLVGSPRGAACQFLSLGARPSFSAASSIACNLRRGQTASRPARRVKIAAPRTHPGPGSPPGGEVRERGGDERPTWHGSR